jgi:Ca-activated chloride channel family protein
VTDLFQTPYLLALALLLPIAAVALVLIAERRKRARLARLGTAEVVSRLMPPATLHNAVIRTILLGTAAALAGIAFAGPRWGVERTVIRSQGIDLVLALDASLSMMATDERPNRLERMRQEVRRLRAISRDDRIALIAFAGRSYILTPLTVDDGAISLFLDNLDPSVVGQAGSSVARAIRQGTALLSSSKAEADRAIVLMSDGESFEPEADVVDAARRAKEAGISLITVGFGTADGAQIPIREGNATVPKRDETGSIVISRYHPEMLKAAAEAAGGTFIEASATDKATRIRRALATLRTQSRATQAGQEQTPRFQLFLIPAFLLLLLDTFLAERRGRRRVLPAAAAPATAALLLMLLFPPAARADEASDAAKAFRAKQYARAASLYREAIRKGDASPQALYNLGTALLAADSLSAATEPLDRAARAKDAELRYRALFNLGLAHLRQGLKVSGDSAKPALDAALATYKKVLLLRPVDVDAKWNYELALREKKSGGGGGGGGGGQNAPKPEPSENSPQQQPQPRPVGQIGQQQAEQLLNSAAREERDVQGKKQKQNPVAPPGGKDW